MSEVPELTKNYSTKKVADFFSVTTGTVRRWIRSGNLKATQSPGGLWLVSEEELRRFANESLEKRP